MSSMGEHSISFFIIIPTTIGVKMNSVQLVGNLGKNPEVRHTANGNAVANFSVATTTRYKGEEQTEWHNVVVWGKLAELCGEYLSKGKKVGVVGSLKYGSYEKEDGTKVYKTEVWADNVEFLSPKGSNDGEDW